MPHIFNAAEIIDMGIEKEKKRRDFYALAAKTFSQPKLKEIFSHLAAWEEAHVAKFTDIRNTVTTVEITESYEGEFGLYIRALVDDRLYDQASPEEFARNVRTPDDAFRYAIGFEKDAILFFNELITHLDGPGRDRIGLLIDEEKKHIIYLTDARRHIPSL